MSKIKRKLKSILKKIIPATFYKVSAEGKRLEKNITVLNNSIKQVGNTHNSLMNEIRALRLSMEQNTLVLKDSLITKTERTNSILLYQHQFEQEMNRQMMELLVENKRLQFMQQLMEDTFAQTKKLDEGQSVLHEGQNMLCDGQKKLAEKQQEQQKQMKRTIDEIVWAHVFNNTISNSSWLEDKSFSPGRWAMGYMELYVLYRVLNEFRPKNILELGLGQSTRMLLQYAASDAEVSHKVIEHDKEWVKFFEHNNKLPLNSEIIQMDLEYSAYKEAEEVRTFKGFKEKLDTEKFDFIMIDAPLGSDMKHYSRIDVLSLLPECLPESFVIVLDDAERTGELKTAHEIDMILEERGIEYRRNTYRGEKNLCIWTTPEWGFLCSL